jgi:transposase-like protein
MNPSCIGYQSTISLRNGSFFENKKSSLRSMLQFLFFFSQSQKQKVIAQNTGLSLSTVKRLVDQIGEIIESDYNDNQYRMGGSTAVVQVDETKLNFNCKSHRGRENREPVWALVIVDTSTTPASGFAEIVVDRTKRTLFSVINRIVRPGSTIHTDDWPSYRQLGNGNYNHASVVHKFHFVDPTTGVHTQHVESYNNKIKRKIKESLGVVREKRSRFLKVFMFFDKHKENVFVEIMSLIKV